MATRWWCGKYCRCSNAPCKQTLPCATGAILVCDSKAQMLSEPNGISFTLLLMPGITQMVNGRDILNCALWHLQYLRHTHPVAIPLPLDLNLGHLGCIPGSIYGSCTFHYCSILLRVCHFPQFLPQGNHPIISFHILFHIYSENLPTALQSIKKKKELKDWYDKQKREKWSFFWCPAYWLLLQLEASLSPAARSEKQEKRNGFLHCSSMWRPRH